MTAHAIILGDAEGILRLPKAALCHRDDWSQRDSDILAHLIQVQSQIHLSQWNKKDIYFQVQGDKLLDHSLPEFQDFVYAAVYFRQLIAPADRLLKDAVTRYRRFVDCPIRSHWLGHELKSFNKVLAGNAFKMPDCTVHDLFDAFMYGAALMHKMPPECDPVRRRFMEIYDKHPLHNVLYSLKMSLRLLMNHVGNVAVVIHRDYSNWLYEYCLPLPDTRWHEKLFEIKTTA
jgi:hypothetical protein